MAKVALGEAGGVEIAVLEDILESASLPAGHLCLVIGDIDLDTDLQAATISRHLAPPGVHTYGLRRFCKDVEWDCGVIVGATWSARQKRFPAYFAYLLGHELGHATTVLTDLTLAAFENLVYRHIKAASGGKITNSSQLPFEQRYDQFGLAVADTLYGEVALLDELNAILDEDLTLDRGRIGELIDLESRQDLSGLGAELAAFTEPFREELVAAWEKERLTAREAGGRPAMSDRIGLEDLHMLWAR